MLFRSTGFALDQPINDLACVGYARRSNQWEIRIACGKRAVATTADHSLSTGQTPWLPEDRPVSPGDSGQNGSNVETSDLPYSKVYEADSSKTGS